jgi:sugar/nucleoside kinase (ribokinase family)
MAEAHCDVLCAGIVVADHVCAPISHLPTPGELVQSDQMILTLGGCAANVAVNLHKLGVQARVIGRVGDDPFAGIFRDLLVASGLDAGGLITTPGRLTSQTMILNVVGQDRRFVHHFGANAAFAAADVPLPVVRQARILYLGGYLLLPGLTQDALAELFAAARSVGVRTVLDVAIPGGTQLADQFTALLPHTDLFLPNTDEAALILGEPDPHRQALAFHQMGAKAVAITRGGDGVVWIDERCRLRAGVYPTQVVDASGSGDAFAAGVIFGLLEGLPPADCLRWGSALGASCVRAIGTTTGVFNREQAVAFMAEHPFTIASW